MDPSVLIVPEDVRAAAIQIGEGGLERRQTLQESSGFQDVRLEWIVLVYPKDCRQTTTYVLTLYHGSAAALPLRITGPVAVGDFYEKNSFHHIG